jgi:hypothetical protein
MTRRRGKGGNLERLKHELITQGRIRPVEDVQAPALGLPGKGKRPAPGNNHHGRERRAQLRRDKAGAPCACSPDGTPCLAHYAISGRRRFIRPT